MDLDSEPAVVERLRRGEPSAFEVVYAAFNRRLYTFLVRMVRDRSVAEDLLEETWLRLVAHARRLRADTRLGPWLFTVARNLCISYRRSRILEDSAMSGLMTLWPTAVERSSPFESAAANELERRIERALASMPASAREVLLLVGVAGLEPADAATVCNLTPEALRQRLHRARALLARELEEDAATRRRKVGATRPATGDVTS
jgi:RNA polymerase sigma-70 factor (ECF subfamily)